MGIWIGFFHTILLFSATANAGALQKPYQLENIKNWLITENISTVEDFVSKLPEEHLKNFTLMNKSKSLQGSSYDQPRAILFGNRAEMVVTFNGSTAQAAGDKVEMMLYDANKASYSFHEIQFNGKRAVVNENPQKCLSCHGAVPRPIWDHYFQWEGAYGAMEDRFTPDEYSTLQAFIAQAPSHPRYKYLKELKEGYELTGTGMVNGYTAARHIASRNRALTLRLYLPQVEHLVQQLSERPEFNQMKPILFYFLGKCYRDLSKPYNGDGQPANDDRVVQLFNDLISGKDSLSYEPYQPAQFIDYIFSRFGVKTSDWYFSSRSLSSYRSFQSGDDHDNEVWASFLLKYAPEYQSLFKVYEIPDQVLATPQAAPVNAEACTKLTSDARASAQANEAVLKKTLPPVVTNTTRYSLLPPMCLKCHSQEATPGKLMLPIQELPARVKNGDHVLLDKLREYITADQGEPYMPMRMNGDDAEYQEYLKRDYPALKAFVDSF